jgi:phage major head subunit gpT-like protein
MITATQSRIIRQTAEGTFLQGIGEQTATIDIARFMGAESTDKVQMDAGFFGTAPYPTEWTGSRQHKRLKSYTQSITPKKWEITVDFDVPTLEDDQTGTAKRTASRMVSSAQAFYLKRFADVLALGTGTTLGTGYDGVALFSGSHPESGTNQDNTHTSAAATGTQPTAAELESALDADFQYALAYTDDSGKPMGGQITDWALMVPPAYAKVFSVVCGSNGSLGGAAAIGGLDVSGVTGSFRGLEVIVNPYITDVDRFYFLKKGGVPPMVLVQRKPWSFDVRDKSSGSDYARDNDVMVFEADARFEVGYGAWSSAMVHVFT